MREQLNDSEMEKVAGGTITINRSTMNMGFTSIGENYELHCSFRDARNFADDLKAANPGLSEAEFEALVKLQFQSRGWIS